MSTLIQWANTEEGQFTRAFHAVLNRNPDKPPSPTQLNRELGRDTNPNYHAPMNVLNGRMSVLRRRLLLENGFIQDEKWARWRKA